MDIAEIKRQIAALPDKPDHVCCLGGKYPDGTPEQPMVMKSDLRALVASHDELLEAAKVARDFLNDQAKHSKQYPGNDLYSAYAKLALAIHTVEHHPLCDEDCELCAEQNEDESDPQAAAEWLVRAISVNKSETLSMITESRSSS